MLSPPMRSFTAGRVLKELMMDDTSDSTDVTAVDGVIVCVVDDADADPDADSGFMRLL